MRMNEKNYCVCVYATEHYLCSRLSVSKIEQQNAELVLFYFVAIRNSQMIVFFSLFDAKNRLWIQ